MKYSYPEHTVDNILDAINLAEYLKEEGEYDLFRGQRKCYDIKPSIFRDGVDLQQANQDLENFATWVHETPDLESLHYNQNAILAVAQHYGIKTNLIDFSSSPKISGYFASDGAVDGDIGTIICLNKRKLVNSWKDINANYENDKGTKLVELIEIDVNNLWRIQAQQGSFLKSHVDEKFLEMMSCFLHIYFKQNTEIKVLESELIYPKDKSHLEVLLEQYFVINTYDERKHFLRELGGEPIVEIQHDVIRKSVESYFINDEIPKVHKSWNSEYAKSWLIEISEDYTKTKFVNESIILNLENADFKILESELYSEIERIINTNDNFFIRWKVETDSNQTLWVTSEGGIRFSEDEETVFSVSEMFNMIYSSMRYLPYDNIQIARSLSRYLIMLRFSSSSVIENSCLIEISGAMIRGLCICDEVKLVNAIRKDFLNYIKPTKLNSLKTLDIRDLIFASIYVKSAYVFEDFIELFVNFLIPSQASIAIENLVVGCNPMRIDIVAHG